MFRFKAILVMFIMASVVSFLLTFFVTAKLLNPNSSSDAIYLQHINVAAEEDIPLVLVQKYYNACGHYESLEYNFMEHEKVNEDFLKNIFSEKDDWTVEFVKGQWIVTQTVEGLCAKDREKRHLRVIDDLIAVYQGPPYYQGNLIYITEISIWDIPPEWRENILNGQTYFNGDKDLLHALDSLDEFK